MAVLALLLLSFGCSDDETGTHDPSAPVVVDQFYPKTGGVGDRTHHHGQQLLGGSFAGLREDRGDSARGAELRSKQHRGDRSAQTGQRSVRGLDCRRCTGAYRGVVFVHLFGHGLHVGRNRGGRVCQRQRRNGDVQLQVVRRQRLDEGGDLRRRDGKRLRCRYPQLPDPEDHTRRNGLDAGRSARCQ